MLFGFLEVITSSSHTFLLLTALLARLNYSDEDQSNWGDYEKAESICLQTTELVDVKPRWWADF